MASEKTGVDPLMLFTTTTLVRVMLPVFVTVPLKVSNAPGTVGLAGQDWVILSAGVVAIAQVALAVLVIVTPQTLSAEPVAVLVTEQLVGVK